MSYFVNPNDDVYGAIVTEKLSFKFLARAFLNLLEYHTAKNKITIDWELAEKVVAQCMDCDEKRNGIVHALYHPTEAGPTRYKSNWRPGKEPAQPVPMSEAELRDLISKTVSTRFALSILFYWYLPNDRPESNFPKANEESDSTSLGCLQ